MLNRCTATVERDGVERPCMAAAAGGSAFCVYHGGPRPANRYSGDVETRAKEVHGPMMFDVLAKIADGTAGPDEAAAAIREVERMP